MIKALLRQLPATALSKIDRADAAQGKPFTQADILVPEVNSRYYGWTHYGVMIPDLPAPHRFFSIMSVIGTPGALAFDTDHALKTSPRNNATVVCGTAATHPSHFGGYSIAGQCHMVADGSHIQFGEEVTITGQYPNYTVKAQWAGFELSIELRCTDKVSWFVKNPVYDHLSLLSHYSGHITLHGKTLHIQGACTFEYARCPSPYLLRNQPLASQLKVPLDFFTYHVVNLPNSEQLLMTQAMVKGVPIITAAYMRSSTAYSLTYRDVQFVVEEYAADELVSPDGIAMKVPSRFRWEIKKNGAHVMSLQGVVDTPLTYGLGSGYVGGYSYTGEYQGQAIAGPGYIEYIDRRVG
ncbi:MAG TPA: DUF6670 family protein [Limnobacter sp.]|uniref:DUF6670 family protein n=1 Tax=Limnobacter sp. TaxID=2003368 RepID=UPI002ED994AC